MCIRDRSMRAAAIIVCVLACTGCRQILGLDDRPTVGGAGDDDDGSVVDDPPFSPQPLHLTADDGEAGTGVLLLGDGTTLDTTTLSGVTLPNGSTFDLRP